MIDGERITRLDQHFQHIALRDAVTETEPAFREDLLADQPVVDLLTEAIQPLADRWKT